MNNTPAQQILQPLSAAWPVAVVFFSLVWGIWAYPLFDLDEGAFSEATREMVASGNYLITTLNGELRSDKPIGIYWLQAAAVHLFGTETWAFRLPSVIASLLWMLVIWRMAFEQDGKETAKLAIIISAGCLGVSVIGRAAIADALLHLFLALTAFQIFRYWKNPDTHHIRLTYLWMSLGFLTKGPVAIVLPLLTTIFLAASEGRWHDWRRAFFSLQGWLILLLVAGPWYLAVWLVHGNEFFYGFFIEHNLERFSSTREGHGGTLLYYFAALPLVLMPFTGWFLVLLGRSRDAWKNDPYSRFALSWLGVAFIIFSFSNTQLPHYILYGCTPLFLLMARGLPAAGSRWIFAGPALLVTVLTVLLPGLVQFALQFIDRPYERALLGRADQVFSTGYHTLAWGLMITAIIISWRYWHRFRPALSGLVIIAVMDVSLLILPAVAGLQQTPVYEAAKIAAERSESVVSYKLDMPSFSVYRNASTPKRLPAPGENVVTRIDRLASLEEQIGTDRLQVLYEKGAIMLLHVSQQELR